jgi:hypothetical protein
MAIPLGSIEITLSVREVGLWCDRCALPSKVDVGMYRLREDGVALVGSFVKCFTEGGCR